MQEARDIFHGVLGFESEVVYWWPFFYLAVLVSVAVSFFCRDRKKGSPADFPRVAVLAAAVFAPLYFWQTWRVVSIIVD